MKNTPLDWKINWTRALFAHPIERLIVLAASMSKLSLALIVV